MMILLKNRIKKLKHASPIKSFVYNGAYFLWSLGRFVLHRESRATRLTMIFSGKGYFQRPTETHYNRYPLLFKACKTYLSRFEQPLLLSFGCSTGEEVFTLADDIPTAIITGVDINQWCIKQAIKKNEHKSCRFYHRTSEEFKKAKGFDAIFCMAVFQRTENRTQKREESVKGFSFHDFEMEIGRLDQKLKPGGLFIIDHTDFSFADTACSKDYRPLDFEHNQILRKRPLFNRNNKKIADTQFQNRVFVKLKRLY